MSQGSDDAKDVVDFYREIEGLQLPEDKLVALTGNYIAYVMYARAQGAATQYAVMMSKLVEQNEKLVQEAPK